MKKRTLFSLFEIRPIAILAITVAAFLLGRPAFALAVAPSHTVDITENSSTSLTLLYDGSDITASAVMNTASDQWTLTFASNIQFGLANQFWLEPERQLCQRRL